MSNDQHPRVSEDHDLLVIPKLGKLQQVAVDRKRVWNKGHPVKGSVGGRYIGASDPAKPMDPGYRKVMSIARPSGEKDDKRGALLACMPVRPEPATSFYTCYLVNGDNAKFKNDWTAAEWNEEPDAVADQAGPWRSKTFEVLLAGPQGSVFHLAVNDGKASWNEVDLSLEAEIWTQLRSGVVVGLVKYVNHPDDHDQGGRVLPIFNLTAVS